MRKRALPNVALEAVRTTVSSVHGRQPDEYSSEEDDCRELRKNSKMGTMFFKSVGSRALLPDRLAANSGFLGGFSDGVCALFGPGVGMPGAGSLAEWG